MTIYVDGILFLNFFIDFLLLLATSVVLKRNIRLFNVVLGAFLGSLSTLVLFFKINSIQLFIIKIYLSIIMNLVSFYYKDLKYTLVNIVTFYLISILFGGFLYLLNIEFSYKQTGYMFYNSGMSINVLILFIIAPVILYVYIRQSRFYAKKVSNYYKVNLFVDGKVFKLNGFLDTGNTLTFKGKPVIITNLRLDFGDKKIMVPYIAINGAGVIECVEARAEIFRLGSFDVLLGFNENINISGVDVILNKEMER